ncbi:MAG: S-layer homology domain-containing protein [Clostridiales bacterium]|nr:S-layer homology domain-containing protein [Clostridiales bacterium]
MLSLAMLFALMPALRNAGLTPEYTGYIEDFTRGLQLENKIIVKSDTEMDTKLLADKYIYVDSTLESPENGVYRLLGPDGGGSPGGIVIPPVTPDIGERFTDLAGFDWARDAINDLAGKGIITGKPGGRFAPGENITRAEIAVLVSRILDKLKA